MILYEDSYTGVLGWRHVHKTICVTQINCIFVCAEILQFTIANTSLNKPWLWTIMQKYVNFLNGD